MKTPTSPLPVSAAVIKWFKPAAGIPMRALWALACLFLLLEAQPARAFIAGPYTTDPYTLHLWHLDETTTPCADSVSSGGVSLAGLLGGATLVNPAYPGFGNSLNTLGTYGYTVWTTNAAASTAFAGAGLFPTTTATAATTMAYQGANGAFTMEALICPLFPVATNFGAVTNGGTGRALTSWQLITGDAGSGTRVWQFRFDPIGVITTAPEPKTGNTQPLLDFIQIPASGSAAEVYAPIPMTGPNAIASNQWFHVAVTYSGVPNTPGNFNFYWTAMDSTNTGDNLILSTNLTASLVAGGKPSFSIGNSGRSDNADWLGAIDEVRMSSVARGPSGMMFALPSVSLTPVLSQFATLGSTVTLSSVASGGLPITYQWQLNGTNINGTPANISGYATNSLVISNVTFAEAGTYTLVAANANSTNSVSATVTVGTPVSGLFNTGLNSSGSLLAGGSVDPNWQLVASADPTYTGPNAYVDSTVPATYIPDGPNSQWIAPGDNVSSAGGYYQYQTTFVLDSQNTTNMQLTVNWAADNECVDIFLNGVDQGFTNGNGFTAFSPNVLTTGFLPGSNVLVCVISNFPGGGLNLSAFRAELSAISAPQPPTPLQILSAPSPVTAYQFQNATFAVTVYGSGPVGYQWFFGTNLLGGQTGRTLLLTEVGPAQAGTYSVVVSNSLSTNMESATLTVLTPDTLEWQGLATADWDLTTTNWFDTTASADVLFAQNDNVLFDNNGSGQPVVSLDLPLTPNSVVVSGSTTYTFAGNGGYLAGGFNLTLEGPGTLIMDAPNTYSGSTIIQGGTLQVGNGDANGSLGTSTISNNAALVFNRADSVTLPNQISGPGSLTMSGPGTLIMTGNNPGFTGPITAANGILTPRTLTAFGTGTSPATVLDGAQIYIDQNINFPSVPFVLGGTGSGGAGALRKGGAGATSLGGPIILSDAAGIAVDASSSLSLTNPAALTSTNNNFAILVNGASTCTIAGAVNLGSGSFTEYGAATGIGTVILTSLSNVWTGGTLITTTNCTLQIGDGGNDGSIGAGTIMDNGVLTYMVSNNFTLNNTVSGGGIFSQSGTGTMLLSGNPLSGFSGTIRTTGNAHIQLAPGDGLTGGSLLIGTGQADSNSLYLTGNNTISIPISIFPRAFTGTITASPISPPTNNPYIVNVSGTNTVSPPTPVTINSGGNLFCLESDSGYLIYNGGVTANGTGREFALQGPGSGEIDGALTQNAGQSLNVYALGSGTWYLNGQSTYTGNTIVSNGLLIINGSVTSSPVSAYGGTLGGTGMLTGPVVIGAGGKLAPTLATNGSIGALTVNNTLTLLPGSTTALQLNKTAATSDQITGLTAVNFGGTLIVTNVSGTLAVGDSFQLFSAGSYAGTFSSISPPTPGPGLSWNLAGLAASGVLAVAAPSATPPTITSAAVSGGNLILSGSGGLAGGGYVLLTTTNLATRPLTNWTQVTNGTFNGSGGFVITNPLPANTHQSFYILDAQ